MAHDLKTSIATGARAPSATPSTTQADEGDEKSRKSLEESNESKDVLPDIEKGTNDAPALASAEKKPFLVEFEGINDPGNPKCWTPNRRWAITVSMGLMVFTVTFASSIFSVNIGYVQQHFEVDLVTATLGVSLFVLVRHTTSNLND